MNVKISQIARRRGRFGITIVQHLIRLMAGGGGGRGSGGRRRMYTCRPDSALHQTKDHPVEK